MIHCFVVSVFLANTCSHKTLHKLQRLHDPSQRFVTQPSAQTYLYVDHS